jgi:eukaryotic-like serine/threonine-protein kinase
VKPTPTGDQKKQPGIFISYRRSDTPDAVGRIYDRLVSEFGKARVFKDVDSIPLGQDFRGHLNDIVGNCAAVLAIIGPKWIDIRDESGHRRLEDPDDFVRIELEAALARKVPVVPVLVGHAAMPATGQLPGSLATLAFRQAVDVRPDPDFHNDATRLLGALRQILDPNAPVVSSKPRRPLKWMAAFAAALFAAAALAIPALQHLREKPPPETRVELSTPDTVRPLDFALSPDGRHIVFVASGDGASRLWLRSLANSTSQPLPGTEGARYPFWSPDSRSVGFFTPTALKRLDLGGGPPQVLATISFGRGGSWNAQGDILMAPGTSGTLRRVPATGGAVTLASRLEPGQFVHNRPAFLPDGRRYLTHVGGTRDVAGIYLGDLSSGTAVRLSDVDASAVFHPSGWLLWSRDGALVAQRLDVEKAALTGEQMTLAEGVGVNEVGFPALSVSATGVIAYRAEAGWSRELTWFDRSGKPMGNVGEPDHTYSNPRVSPDGRRVAVERRVRNDVDIWLMDDTRTIRFTVDPAYDERPVWSPDGGHIYFRSTRTGAMDIFGKSTSGTGTEDLLFASELLKVTTGISPDGRFLMFFQVDPQTPADMVVLPLFGDRKPYPFLQPTFAELWGVFSPDGQWLAYQSNESGRNEIYVRPFVAPGGADAPADGIALRAQVSAAGGSLPLWRPDGREIFFLSPAGEMMAASVVVKGPTIVPGAPVRLFPTGIFGGGTDNQSGRQYDVAPDGRFLINTELSPERIPPIMLIQNWDPLRQD